jgi:hypothetical protein
MESILSPKDKHLGGMRYILYKEVAALASHGVNKDRRKSFGEKVPIANGPTAAAMGLNLADSSQPLRFTLSSGKKIEVVLDGMRRNNPKARRDRSYYYSGTIVDSNESTLIGCTIEGSYDPSTRKGYFRIYFYPETDAKNSST